MARDAFAHFKGFQLHLVEVHDLAPLAEAAFHEQTRQRFFCFVQGGEVDVPKVTARLENMDGVEKAVGVLIDFSDHARARISPLFSLDVPPQMQFLSGLQLFREAQHAPIAADQQGLHRLRERGTLRCGPRRLDRHAQADTVALPEPIG